jgi:riboflavin kinase/FMN adenylyltransferase
MLQQAGDAFGFRVEAMRSVIDGGVRISSSAVREALWNGNLERAAELLGRPYVIDGRVVHGEKVGRQLGYATANIRMKHDRPPLLGVFAVEVTGLGGKPLPGVANLGYRPTANAVVRPILEVHLFDFAADIYGAHLTVRFLHKIRDEMKFPGFDALKAQIARDVDTARQYFKL